MTSSYFPRVFLTAHERNINPRHEKPLPPKPTVRSTSSIFDKENIWPFRKEMTIMFTQRDRDHDGLLSFEEFAGQETKLEKAFKAIDKDGDGYLTKASNDKILYN